MKDRWHCVMGLIIWRDALASLLRQTHTTLCFGLQVAPRHSMIVSTFGSCLLFWDLLCCIGNRDGWPPSLGWTLQTRGAGSTKSCRTIPQGWITLRWITENHLAIIDDKVVCLTRSIHWTWPWLGMKLVTGMLGLLLSANWMTQPWKHMQLLLGLWRATSSHIITPMCSHHPPSNRLSMLSLKQPNDWISKTQKAYHHSKK